MARIRTLQASFSAGEVSEYLYGREDADFYSKGAAILRNVYVTPQGGVFRREGLQHIAETTNSSEARLVPFEFNDEETYLLSFTPGQFRVYKTDDNGVQATVSSSPISGLDADIIKEMNWTQSADTLFIVHKDVQPIRITRTSDVDWTAEYVTFSNIPSYAFGSLSTSNPAGSVTPDVRTGRVVLTGVGTSFASSWVGQYINMPKGGRIFVRQVNSTTSLEGDITIELAATTAVTTGNWELEEGYEPVISSTRGWVRAITFYKGRLVLAGLGSRPRTVLFSRVAEFFDLSLGTGLEDEAIDITIDSDKVDVITGVFPGRALQIFTTGGEYSLRSAINEALTPENAASQLGNETSHGSGNPDQSVVRKTPRPLSVDGATIFVESGGAVVRQFVFNDSEDSFNANNISVFSPHLFRTPVSMDLRKANSRFAADFLYVVNSDGTCAVLNSLREQSLLAWTLFETDGEFEDVAVAGRMAYFVVKRTINGTDYRFIERLSQDHFLDCSVLQTDVSAKTTWTGLSHLNGATLSVRGDDFVLDDAVPSSGSITVNDAVNKLEAGLFFAVRIRSLPVSVIVQGQSFSGEWKSLLYTNIRLYESREIDVIVGRSTYRPPFLSFGPDVLDAAAMLFSGWKKVHCGTVNRDVSVEITQSYPTELNVLSIQYGVSI